MRWRLSVAPVLLLMVCVGPALASVQTIALPAPESRMTVLADDTEEMRFRIEVGELKALEVNTREGSFTRLFIPGFHASQTVGSPELPMMNRLIQVPYGASARVEVLSSTKREIDLAEFGIDAPLMPAQPSMPKSADPASWPFVYDTDAYQADKVSQELAGVVGLGRLRAMDLVRVEISPVEYYPDANRLVVFETLDVRVVFEGGDEAAGEDLWTRTNSHFFRPVYDRVAGFSARGEHDDYPDLVSDVVTMVIVTPSSFEAQLQDFVDWKTERGFHVVVGVIGSPEVGSTTASIQSYIHDLYNNATPELPAPSFVVFVGDVAQCPTFTVDGDATDRPYCAVDGDELPDIYYGRLSATNSSELQAILDKTMMYDQYTMPDPSYLGEVTLIAGVDSYYATTHANGQLNYGTTHYFNASHGISSNTYLYPASGSASSAIIQSVSDGVGFINYTAHGSVTSWADPSFTQSDINSLSNSGQYCLAIGNCCVTSTYDYSECFAETWLRAADKGAIGYIGGSNNTYWDEDYWWGVGYHPSSEIDGTAYPYASTGMGAYDGLFHDHGEAMTQWYVVNDAIIFCGNLAVTEAGSSLTSYYWNIYNLIGDPSLSTFLGVPSANPVSTSALGSSSITVSAAPGSYVGLTQNGTLVGAGTVGASGTEVIDFFTTLAPGVDLHMVVMAQNRIPHVEDIPLAAPQVALSATAFSKTLAPDETGTDELEVSNLGEAGSVLVYTVGIQAEAPTRSDRSIDGSTFTCDAAQYLPGTTVDLQFTIYNASTDTEWIEDASLDFPAGVVVNSSTNFVGGSGGPMDTDNSTGDGALVSWHGETTSGWGVIQGGETATATVNVTFGSGLSGTQDIAWTMDGDVYGSEPHSLNGTISLTVAGPTVTVTAPNGGEMLAIGSSETITWDYSGSLEDVKIDLSRDNGSNWESLTASTPNDGSFTWDVTGPSSALCLVRVSSLDESVLDTGDDVFTIFQPVDWLAVTPESGQCAQGETDILTLQYDAAGMADGTYRAYVMISHNASGSPEVVTVDLEVSNDTSVPDGPMTFALEGNYPNPFNPVTNISFTLPDAAEVRIDVLDVSGRLVRTLEAGELPAGRRVVSWDGRDNEGHQVATGVYLARLHAGEFEATSKMVLVK